MKNTILLLFVVTLLSCKQQNKINYKVAHLIKDGVPVLNVEMTFKANNENETILSIKDEAWGQSDLFKTISNLKSDQTTQIIKQKDSGWIVLKHKKGTKHITLNYTLSQDFDGPMVYTKFYRPIVQESYFHLLAHSMLMLPKDYVNDINTKFDVNIEWDNFEPNYSIINSFGSNTKTQKIKNTDAEEFYDAIFTGGDYRVFNLNINGNKVLFSTRGQWNAINDSDVANYIKQTIQIQRDFWQDHTQEYFTVLMTPTFLKEGSALQGTSVKNSFATAISNNDFLKIDDLIKLFNHELMHNWMGGVIDYESEEQYWFSEGFTEYLALKNIANNKIGALDESYFIKEFNQYIQRLFGSSAKEVPNNEIMDHYWDDFEYNRLPYRRGVIFAFYLDNKIKHDSNGQKNLQDLLLELKKHAVNSNIKVTHKHFLEVANSFLNKELNSFFVKHIENGNVFDFQTIFDEFQYDFNTSGEVFDLGFTIDDSKKNIAEIDTTSNAYKCGLRKGDRIVSQSYNPGNPNNKASIKVLKNNKRIPFTFFPSKKAAVLSLVDNLINRKKISSLGLRPVNGV